jgi:hypothetical protein
MHRRVLKADIQDLRLHRLYFSGNKALVGAFTNIYHWNHAEAAGEEFGIPPILG